MTASYHQAVAAHYAAYRPPLHQLILERVLSGEKTFSSGLDVGCGTGRSAVALAAYCAHVYGVDPSQAMLSEATKHERITYLNGAGEDVPLPGGSVDVVTLAGSLFYADRRATARELKRVGRKNALVVPYDFEILLDEALRQQGVGLQKAAPDYDHRANFSGAAGFAERVADSEQVSLSVTAAELAHVLLADARRYEVFAKKHGASDPFPALERALRSTGDAPLSIRATLYYATYQLTEK